MSIGKTGNTRTLVEYTVDPVDPPARSIWIRVEGTKRVLVYFDGTEKFEVVLKPYRILDRIATAPTACYALIQLLIAYIGPLIRLRRTSDQVEKDFYAAPGGALDVTAILAWLSGVNGRVVSLYDQGANNWDFTQASANDQPLFVADEGGGVPAILFVDDNMGNADVVATQPFTFRIVADSYRSEIATLAYIYDSPPASRVYTYFQNGVDGSTVSSSGGTIVADAVDHRDKARTSKAILHSGQDSEVRTNDVADVDDTMGSNDLVSLVIGARYTFNQSMDGHLYQFLLFDSEVSEADSGIIWGHEQTQYEVP